MPAITRTSYTDASEAQLEREEEIRYRTDMALDAEAEELANLEIPDVVIRRLPIYTRTLRMLQDRDQTTVSSEQLAGLIGITAAQIRRDLSYFGKFGKQGKGYDVSFLGEIIAEILKLDRTWDMVLCGMGNLGHAIANYRGFRRTAFDIVGLYDTDEANIGTVVNGLTIQPMSDLVETVRRDGVRVGIIATPRTQAQEVADLLVEAGVQAILNYAPVILRVPAHVTVREIDPVSALQSMTYYISD